MSSIVTGGLLSALKEIRKANQKGVVFWWRQASARKLCELGLVSPRKEHAHLKRPSWVMTPEGYALLERLEAAK